MKVQTLLLFTFLTSVLMFSCTPKQALPEDNHVTFDTVSVDTLCRLIEEQEQPECHFRIKIARPVEAKEESALPAIQSFIINMVKQGAFAAASGSKIENMVKLYAENYIEQYRKDGRELLSNYTEQPEEGYGWLSFEEYAEGKPLFNQFGFLSYQVTTYTFAGGAHGETQTRVGVLDLKTLYPVSLLDLFDIDMLPMVSEKIQQQLMKDNDCKTLDDLAENFIDPAAIVATDNFFIDQRGVSWMYDPYEIAPYAMGTIRITVPWTELREFLLADSPVVRIADFGK